eukprot:205284_1
MNEYPNPSRNIPNTWAQAAPQTTSSFNTYALNTKAWGPTPPNQSGSNTPTTNPGLTATFPSFSGGIPPLYPSISAQSSNSIQGGAPSPFGPQNLTSNPPNTSSHIGGQPNTKTNKQDISQSSSASSLTALTGPMGKLHINTSYNPYTAGFNPSDFASNSNAGTPNLPNSNGTPTGFRFNANYNAYSSIATPTTPLNANAINKWGTATTNSLQTTAAMNNINAINMNYNKIYNAAQNQIRMKMNAAANATATTPGNLSANSSYGVLPHLSNPSSANQSNNNLKSPPNEQTTADATAAAIATTHTTTSQCKLNSNAVPYQPTHTQPLIRQPHNTLQPTLKPSPIEVLKTQQQLHHQQKAERVPYSYPSYADAVSKTEDSVIQDARIPKLASKDPTVDTDNPSEAQVKMSDESEEAIQALNPVSWPCNPRHSKFYVIKSFGEDDVHKSIKYNLWCSTERGNRKLDEAFNESKRINQVNNAQNKDKDHKEIDPRDTTRGCPVYLFFSVNRSGCFCGMAQMISNYYKDRHFGSWVQDGKWQGSFIVKWIYVKDIPNKDLKDIQLPNNDNRPVTFSRDTQEIPFAQGVEMLRRFIKYEPKTNILQDFKYYDDRERDIKHKRTQQIILQQLQPQMGPAHAMNKDEQLQNDVGHVGHMNMNNSMYHSHAPAHNTHFAPHAPQPHAQQQQQHRGRNNKYSPQNHPQIEGYSNYDNHQADNKRHWHAHQNKPRKYYSKNDRNNNRSNNRYNNSRYNNNSNQQQSSQYGNYQILKRNPPQPQQTQPGSLNAPNTNQNSLNQGSANNTLDEQNNENNRGGRYNPRNRNRWVPK